MVSPADQLVFGPTVEGLFVRGLKGKLTPELVAALRAAGIDVERPILPAYPRATIGVCVTLVAKGLYPTLPDAEAWYHIGKHVSLGVKNMTLGGATLALLRVLGPKRAVARLARTFRTTNNYMNVELRELGPTVFELDLTPSNEQPSYMQAVIEDVMTYAGAENLKVDVKLHDKARELATYRISFD